MNSPSWPGPIHAEAGHALLSPTDVMLHLGNFRQGHDLSDARIVQLMAQVTDEQLREYRNRTDSHSEVTDRAAIVHELLHRRAGEPMDQFEYAPVIEEPNHAQYGYRSWSPEERGEYDAMYDR